jgi:indole-3-glycerol phosphate synthase
VSILAKIVASKKEEVAAKKTRMSPEALMMRADFVTPARDFRGALTAPGLSLIAEIKRCSPSRGVLRNDLDPGVLAVGYETAGADAISVLTDRRYFGGGLDDLVMARAVTRIPVMRKDFIIDEYQVFESKAYGADAVLLIAGLHDEETLTKLLALCRLIGLAALVEAHTGEEAAKAVAAGADIIGINNRDLKTFEVDISVTERLLPGLPDKVLKVSESGIGGKREAGRARMSGADAVLVGESLVKSDNMQARINGIKQAGQDG